MSYFKTIPESAKNSHLNRQPSDQEIAPEQQPGKVANTAAAPQMALPLVLRETGSGSLEVITAAMRKQRLRIKELNIRMHLGSTESIKTFLRTNNCLGFVSVHAVRDELRRGEFKIIPIGGMAIQCTFHFIYPQGQQNGLAEQFFDPVSAKKC